MLILSHMCWEGICRIKSVVSSMYLFLKHLNPFWMMIQSGLPVNQDNESYQHHYRDIIDGTAFKNNILLKSKPNSLRIILYQDAFEMCNPLGSSRKKHIILGVYMTFSVPTNPTKYCTCVLYTWAVEEGSSLTVTGQGESNEG